jgi:phosphoribosylaminoimidazole carboxylase (NCAIR synthetase)
MNFTPIKLGILGGGQLGKMLIQEATNLNLEISVLDPIPIVHTDHFVKIFIKAILLTTNKCSSAYHILQMKSDLVLIKLV